jgi:peroxiredoxin
MASLVGRAAPGFTVAAINHEGNISLADYSGRSALLLGLFRGLHCPFCRRQVVQMNGYADRLAELGVEGLAIINTELDRARLYYGRLGLKMALAVDPEWQTHRRFGLARAKITLGRTKWPETINPITAVTLRLNPTGELPAPVPMIRMNAALNRIDGFERTAVDKKMEKAHGKTGAGYVLIDREGIVRWQWLEGETGARDVAKFPSATDILTAVAAALN